MRVLIFANSDGGLYQFRRELILALQEKYEVFCSVPNEDGYIKDLEELGCTCIETALDRRSMDPRKDMKLLRNYRTIIRELNPDIVLTYTIKPNVYGGIACRMLHVPYAANITGLGTSFQNSGPLKTLVTKLYQVALKRANTVFFENAENRQILLNANIVKAEQTCLLHGAGVNLEHFYVQPYPQEEGEIRFLFVGRVMREKGIYELLSAMEMLREDEIPCRLDVVGPFEEDVKDTLARYEAQGWLKCHGHQDDVRPFIAACHCFVLPSWHEGMANTNLECAASGRPVITSRIHGCMEAVVDGESGLLCETKNADNLYQVMKHFCQLPWDERKAMGERGRQHMEAVFDKKRVVQDTLKRLGLE